MLLLGAGEQRASVFALGDDNAADSVVDKSVGFACDVVAFGDKRAQFGFAGDEDIRFAEYGLGEVLAVGRFENGGGVMVVCGAAGGFDRVEGDFRLHEAVSGVVEKLLLIRDVLRAECGVRPRHERDHGVSDGIDEDERRAGFALLTSGDT